MTYKYFCSLSLVYSFSLKGCVVNGCEGKSLFEVFKDNSSETIKVTVRESSEIKEFIVLTGPGEGGRHMVRRPCKVIQN
jgi:hypothetical protein